MCVCTRTIGTVSPIQEDGIQLLDTDDLRVVCTHHPQGQLVTLVQDTQPIQIVPLRFQYGIDNLQGAPPVSGKSPKQ